MPATATFAPAQVPARAHARTVAEAMVTAVKLSGPTVTVRELRVLFTDNHVHSALVVDGRVLLAVVDRADLDHAADDEFAVHRGRLAARTVAPGADLGAARAGLLLSGRRRLAVVTADGELLGLLCLKRRRDGFCSDRDVRARAADPRP